MSRYHHRSKRERNRSPPTSSFSQRHQTMEDKPRRVHQVTSAADHAELEKHYSFLPSDSTDTYQDRMVKHYHSHLYKEYVLADLTRPGQVGLRWRMANEVESGKGHTTCGNKHCPSYEKNMQQQSASLKEYIQTQQLNPQIEEEEQALLEKVSYGLGLHDYEVPFTYEEHGNTKTELVKLRLCLRCAPLLFRKKKTVDCALEARKAREQFDDGIKEEGVSEKKDVGKGDSERKRGYSSESSCSSTDSYERRKNRRKTKKKKKRRKK